MGDYLRKAVGGLSKEGSVGECLRKTVEGLKEVSVGPIYGRQCGGLSKEGSVGDYIRKAVWGTIYTIVIHDPPKHGGRTM